VLPAWIILLLLVVAGEAVMLLAEAVLADLGLAQRFPLLVVSLMQLL
jgi:hypothetical protein